MDEKPLRRNQRRRVPRIPANFPVTLTWGKSRIRSQARQFSEFGILLASTRKDLVGENVRLDLALEPPNPHVSLPGLVVYATDDGIGIRFEAILPEQHVTLKKYVQARGIA